MKKKLFLISMMFVATSSAWAQGSLNKQQYAEDSKRAATRYADDKKLCADETSSASRMQCLRDAKTEYNNALATAKANATQTAVKPLSSKSEPMCADCGKVIAVDVSDKEGDGSALGVIAGGVAGALLGNQVGGGTGRDLATIAGAAGGAFAGHKIEQRVKSSKVWTVTVQYDNGSKNSFQFDHEPGLISGDLVKNNGNTIVRR
ncbi:glycine zipper 2TM domain-containing protein [Undibacterium sp. SXout7W]|uniref:glycine zipper 2TM domain-containing protein n=1 Tax=Undibacterium sp. SXout7W TaxID=3413049 RepID=UPI003BF1258A